MNLYITLLFFCAFTTLLKCSSSLNVILKTVDECVGTHYPNSIKIKNIRYLGNHVHKFDFSVNLISELGDNTKVRKVAELQCHKRSQCRGFLTEDGPNASTRNIKYKASFFKKNRKLPISLGGKNLCKVATSLGGEIFVSVLNKLGVESCPMPKGEFTVTNFTADFKKVKLQLPIKGMFRVEILITDTSDKSTGCIEVINELL